MGRSGDEFWALTYREVFACVDAYLEGREERLALFGTVAAATYNAMAGEKFKWTDIFRSRHAETAKEEPKDSLAAIRDQWRIVHAGAGGNR